MPREERLIPAEIPPVAPSGHREEMEVGEIPLGGAPTDDAQPSASPRQEESAIEEPGDQGMDIDVVDEELNYVLSLGEHGVRRETRKRHRDIIEVAFALGTCGRS